MTETEDKEECSALRLQSPPSEAEVSQLLQDAARQYEECMRAADLADISDIGEMNNPKYAWDNPIGLVVTGRSSAELV